MERGTVIPTPPHQRDAFSSAGVILLATVALLCPAAHAAVFSGRPLFQYAERLYRTEQGLPQNEIRSIAQTPDGYLWFGTRDGLARFDGVRFIIYRAETTPGLGHNMFGALLVDHTGKLWIATGDGLSCYEHGKFTRYTERDGLPTNAIHSLLEDGAGKLWIGTWNGLATFDGTHFRTFTTRDGLPDNAISGLAEDGQGGLWIGTYGGGLAHRVNGRFLALNTKDGLPSDVIETVFRDRGGRLWVGTLRGTGWLNAAGKFENIRELPGKAICLFEDRHGSIWAATDKVFARLPGEAGAVFQPEQGPGHDVETLFEDREHSLWIGTTSGLARYREGPFLSYPTGAGMAANSVQTVFEDSKANVWLGTADGLSRWSQGKLQSFAGKAELGDGEIHSITQDQAGRIWVATAKGIAQFDGHSWKQAGVREHFPADAHELYTDRAGRIWIGSPEGLTIWDHGRVSRITARDGLPGNYVISILEDREGRVWVGTVTGLACLDHGKITTYTKANGLLSNYVQCLYQDAEGALWICTPSGLHRLKDGRIRAFTVKDGMFADSILQILEDDQRRFWISSYRGIFRVNKDDLNALADGARGHLESVAYGTEEGMKSNVCGGLGRQPAGWKARNGTLWFPTEEGVVSVTPSQLPPMEPPPQPVLEATLQDGVPATSASAGPDVHRIEFRFTAPTSIAPEEVEFRYRMLGYEDQWRPAGIERLIAFTNLPRGAYRFAVSARRRGGEWSAEGARAALQVLPHFYETRWFFATAGLLTMLLLWLGHSLRVQQTERRLHAVMAERSRVAQELHDTLLQSLSGTAMQIQAALQRLRQGATDIGFQQLSTALVHMGKSMADARQAIWDLKSPELQELRLDHALRAASQRVCAGGPQLNYVVSGKPRVVGAVLEKQIYRIAVEAITNAVRHSGCRQISVELDYQNDLIRLRVWDDGCGFDLSLAESAARTNHWGLSGMKERARQCSGRFTIQSSPGAGTELRFEAPSSQPA